MPYFFFRVENQFCLISWSTFTCSRIGLKLRFWNFQPIFLSMQFWHWLEGFYFFVICLTWNFHLKRSHGILIFISFDICRRKCQGSRFSHLEADTWHFGLSKHIKGSYKFSNYMDHIKVQLRSKPNIGLSRNYFSFLLSALCI